ncbi:hypothetical protein I546_0792 [Mycobacterium kansasii 732]|nr:hypothetical protein I546_0792 [Mycobacterium kansasii 732]
MRHGPRPVPGTGPSLLPTAARAAAGWGPAPTRPRASRVRPGSPRWARPSGDEDGGENAQCQAAQRHVEDAADLLGQIVAIDRVRLGAGRCRKAWGQDDAEDDARNAEREQKSGQRRDQPAGQRIGCQVEPKPDRQHRGDQIEARQRHGVIARIGVIQHHRRGQVGQPHHHRTQAPRCDEQQAVSGRCAPDRLGYRPAARGSHQGQRREDGSAGRPRQEPLVSDSGGRGVLRDAVECVDFAADRQDPHDDSGDQRRGSQRNRGQPVVFGALQHPPGRDQDRNEGDNAIDHRRVDHHDVLLAEPGGGPSGMQRVSHPPDKVETSAEGGTEHRRIADDSGGQQPVAVLVIVGDRAGDRRLCAEHRAGGSQPAARPDTARHVDGATEADRLERVVDDERQHQQQIRGVEAQTQPACPAGIGFTQIRHHGRRQRQQRHQEQDPEQDSAAARNPEAEIQIPWEEQCTDHQHTGGQVPVDVPPL